MESNLNEGPSGRPQPGKGKPKRKQMITPKQKAVILFACIVFAMVVAVTVTQ